jgi:nucleoside 2-deoxyribosyltransferase
MAKPRVFVSYSHKEADWAREFAQALGQRGLQVWIDQLAVKAGESIREAIEKGLRESDVFVTLIDPSSLSSPSLFFELGAAIGMGKRVVAIVPEDFDPSQLPLPLRARRFLIKRAPEATASELLGTEQGTGSEA